MEKQKFKYLYPRKKYIREKKEELDLITQIEAQKKKITKLKKLMDKKDKAIETLRDFRKNYPNESRVLPTDLNIIMNYPINSLISIIKYEIDNSKNIIDKEGLSDKIISAVKTICNYQKNLKKQEVLEKELEDLEEKLKVRKTKNETIENGIRENLDYWIEDCEYSEEFDRQAYIRAMLSDDEAEIAYYRRNLQDTIDMLKSRKQELQELEKIQSGDRKLIQEVLKSWSSPEKRNIPLSVYGYVQELSAYERLTEEFDREIERIFEDEELTLPTVQEENPSLEEEFYRIIGRSSNTEESTQTTIIVNTPEENPVVQTADSETEQEAPQPVKEKHQASPKLKSKINKKTVLATLGIVSIASVVAIAVLNPMSLFAVPGTLMGGAIIYDQLNQKKLKK